MASVREKVAALMREVAAQEIMPRFRALAEHEIEEKTKGDLVTVADRNSELWLAPRLEALVPGSRALGEEAVAADPSLLVRLDDDTPLWTIDPVDGTSNFVAGRETFGVMVSLVEKGETTGAWIYLPVTDEFVIAESGAGAFLYAGGETKRLDAGEAAQDPSGQTASFYVRFMPDDWRKGIETHAATVGGKTATLCSAWDYTSIARGRHDFVTYYRMLPWDHAPGALILREAGGVARDIETGLDYSPRTLKGPHLLARDEESWQRTAELIRAHVAAA
ncbi:inositol monophosphatase [Parvibaculum lavamentivorans DS-1]|uniref:Inositol monophosphatase n=1 Tax=Parvibaculum lavamentivorans (strain DS-1 / DSM 13023 / NCIMB 13966) TaxID=402881 RepID=A7HXU6_PARL1|nr:inositol monophosphatase family protein [Parvibaculum lavamentivorans]ABS64729.1 inositol monophosphatase [Parvibaculum lavamentivorans DS-1]